MTLKTITSADAVFILVVDGLFPVPFRLQGFKADSAWMTEDVTPSENVMGVDGHMSSGFTPYMTPQAISLMPDSPSSDIFEDWLTAQKAARTVFFAQGQILLPSTQRAYTMIKGSLSKIKQIPDGKKVLEGRDFTITWEDIQPAAYIGFVGL